MVPGGPSRSVLPSGSAVSGRLSREIFSSEAEMMRYEVAYNGLAKRFPTVTLCQYDVRTFTGEVVYEAFKAHPDVYGMRAGTFLS